MLSRSDRFKVLQFWRIFSIVAPFPIHIDLQSWTLHAPSLLKQCICAISYAFVVLQTLYKNCSLVHAYFFVPNVQLHQLIIHAAVAVGPAMCAFWYYVAYFSDPGLFAAYAQAALIGNIGGPSDLHDRLEEPWTSRLRKYSMEDLIAISLPYMIAVSVPVINCSYLYDPSMRLLLYAALPAGLQSGAAFGLLMLEEYRFLIVLGMIVTPTFQLQVISFKLLAKQLQLLIQRVQRGNDSPRNVYRTLRRLQLFVSMLNNVNRNVIFTWKLFSIFMCIVCGYAMIAHFGEHPIFGVMFLFLLVDCAFCYTVIYGKAFKVPQMMDQAAACALLRMRRSRTNVLRRQILSIRRTGVRVGEFHQMERVSTPVFINYVLTNIVNMLVACR